LDLYQENRRVSDLDQTKQDILMVGVGGQGIILASDILGEAALEKGLDIKKTDTLGMAQRGGSVTSHLRIGQKVWSPLTSPAEADILLAFEKLEAARWVNYLKPGGLAIINNLAIPPLSISLGSQKYPGDQEILDSFKQRTSRLCLVDGSGKIAHLGDTRTLNIFMLGFLSTFLPLDIDSAAWESCLRKQLPSRILDINLRAFEKGREEALSVNIR
jgi:indolepyruvate ferredoxin oxidoreductase beta subunit